MTALLTGFAVSISLILAIGAQNAFVLRMGLLRSHVLPLVLFCALSDAILITAGVAGFGAITSALPWLPMVMALAGAIFLIFYGFTRAKEAWTGTAGMEIGGAEMPLRKVLLTAAAITWLNPHVYLDTLGLIGAVSVQYFTTGGKLAFGIGAVAASFVFFFSLGFGARMLAPLMRSPKAWRLLDAGIAVVMWVLAAKLLLSLDSF